MRRTKFYVRHKFMNEDTGLTEFSKVADVYKLNVFPESDSRTMESYGERNTDMLTCSARNESVSNIKRGDAVYINTSPLEEEKFGDNADYIVISSMVGNRFTELKFDKQQKEV